MINVQKTASIVTFFSGVGGYGYCGCWFIGCWIQGQLTVCCSSPGQRATFSTVMD